MLWRKLGVVSNPKPSKPWKSPKGFPRYKDRGYAVLRTFSVSGPKGNFGIPSSVRQLQKELEDTRAGTTQIVQDASKEIESAKSQARVEVQRIKLEAQSVVSSLEGKITELVRINGELSMKSVEQIKMINALTQSVDEQQSLLSKLQSNLAMSPTSRAAVGTDGLVPLQLPVASGIGQSRLSRDSEMRLHRRVTVLVQGVLQARCKTNKFS